MSWLIPRNELTIEQSRAVVMHPRAHRLVLGSPGSGKTIVLLHRSRHLVDEYRFPPERYRIFVFTNALKAYIRAALKDLRLPDDCVITFDDWCRKFHEARIDRRLPWEKRGPDFKAIRQAVWEKVRSLTDSNRLYDFAMIDEGQDLDTQAYEILKAVAKHVTVFMDHKQQIYDNGVDELSVLATLGLRKRNLTLLHAYRCSPYIARVAGAFVHDESERQAFLAQNQTIEKGERQTPLLYLAQDFEDERNHMIEMVRTRVDKGDRVAILFPTKKYVYGYASALREVGLEIEVPSQPGRLKKNPSPTIDFNTLRPKVMPYPSAKGLTFDTVLMPLLRRNKFPKFLHMTRLERWLFVGISRATRWVYFSASGHCAFLERFQQLKQQGQLTIKQGDIPRPPEPPPGRSESEPEDDLRDLF